MGKTLIQQARGHGSMTYRVRRKAFSIWAHYPGKLDGEYVIAKIVSSAGHTAPLIKVTGNGKTFFTIAAHGVYEGQKIKIGGKENGDISKLGDMENGTKVFNIEIRPDDGGKLVRTGGSYATITSVNKSTGKVVIALPSKKEKIFSSECKATIGIIAGAGRLDKPILKAGKQYYIKKARSKLWPRTSAVKMNAIDHPFGSGRGKRIKSKIAKSNAPPGAKVGHIRPRRTGVRR
jgi:large subunit ribosomal protein L2